MNLYSILLTGKNDWYKVDAEYYYLAVLLEINQKGHLIRTY